MSDDWGNDPVQQSDHDDWGNDPVVTDKKAKGLKSAAANASQTSNKDFSKFDRFSYGLAQTLVGAGQLVAHADDWLTGADAIADKYHVQTAGQRMDAEAKRLETEYEKHRADAGQTGTDWWNIAGMVANPLNFMGGGEATIPKAATSIGMRALQTGARVAGQGAKVAAMQPVTSGDFATEKAKQIGVGIPAALITHGILKAGGATVSQVVAPVWSMAKKVFGDSVGATSRAAIAQIMERLAQDKRAGGPTAQDMLDVLKAGQGKPLTLADLGGENLSGLVGSVSRHPGEARQVMTKFFGNRDIDAGLRMSNDVSKHIASGNSFDAASALMESRATAAKPLYEKAFAENYNIKSPEVDAVLETDTGRRALRIAARKMRDQGLPVGKADATGIASGLNLRTLDYVKRAYDDLIESASRKGAKDDVRIWSQQRDAIVKAAEEGDKSGVYKAAREAYSGPSESMDAIREGEKVFAKAPEEIAKEFSSMSKGDKEFYRLGMASAIRKDVTSLGPGSFAKRLARAGDLNYRRAQIRAAFGNDADFDRYMESVDAEGLMKRTSENALGNSKTAMRLAEDNDRGNSALANAGQAAWHASHNNWLGFLSSMRRALADSAATRDPAINAEMARILTTPLTPRGSAGMNLLRDFSQAAPQVLRRNNSVGLAPARIAASFAPALVQPSQQTGN